MKAFFDSLPGVVDAIEASDEVRDAFVFAAWRYVAGERTSERTCPLAVNGKRLSVAVADKTWKRNLESLASQLLFKLNYVLGNSFVDRIDFEIEPDAIDFAPTDAKTRSDVSIDLLPPEVMVSARSIGNEVLRETLLRAAANCLARPK